jgi:hypothetical protein
VCDLAFEDFFKEEVFKELLVDTKACITFIR